MREREEPHRWECGVWWHQCRAKSLMRVPSPNEMGHCICHGRRNVTDIVDMDGHAWLERRVCSVTSSQHIVRGAHLERLVALTPR